MGGTLILNERGRSVFGAAKLQSPDAPNLVIGDGTILDLKTSVMAKLNLDSNKGYLLDRVNFNQMETKSHHI